MQLIDGLEQVDTLKALSAYTFECLKVHHALSFSYAHSPPVGAKDFNHPAFVDHRGIPDEWIEKYCARGYQNSDPIASIALSKYRPFLWREVRALKKISAAEDHYLKALNAAGFENGVCIPVFGPRGRSGYFGIEFARNQPAPDRHQMQELQWFCQAVHLTYCELATRSHKELAPLSLREAEVLKCVLRDLTNKEVAYDLGISTNSVSTYLRRAHEKLETRTRISAATRALVLGLLD